MIINQGQQQENNLTDSQVFERFQKLIDSAPPEPRYKIFRDIIQIPKETHQDFTVPSVKAEDLPGYRPQDWE